MSMKMMMNPLTFHILPMCPTPRMYPILPMCPTPLMYLIQLTLPIRARAIQAIPTPMLHMWVRMQMQMQW